MPNFPQRSPKLFLKPKKAKYPLKIFPKTPNSTSQGKKVEKTDLVYGLTRGGVSTEVTPDLLTSSTGGGAGRQRPGPPDKALSLLETRGAVSSTDSTVVQHLPAVQPEVAAHTVALAGQADGE